MKSIISSLFLSVMTLVSVSAGALESDPSISQSDQIRSERVAQILKSFNRPSLDIHLGYEDLKPFQEYLNKLSSEDAVLLEEEGIVQIEKLLNDAETKKIISSASRNEAMSYSILFGLTTSGFLFGALKKGPPASLRFQFLIAALMSGALTYDTGNATVLRNKSFTIDEKQCAEIKEAIAQQRAHLLSRKKMLGLVD